MGKADLDNKLRADFFSFISEYIQQKYDTDALLVDSNKMAVPVLDDEKNEKWVLISVSVPRGERDGKGGYIPYDGYKQAEEYQDELREAAEKKAAAAAKKQAKIAKDKQKRAEKAALAEANKGLKELRKINLKKEGE